MSKMSWVSARSLRKPGFRGRSIDWISVAALSYFNVSGGPWGSEGIVAAAGPLPGFIGIAAMALCSALPMILITTELSCMFPDDGGYSIWVAEAFGEFWGFQESYWSWVSGVLDNALYPTLAYGLLRSVAFPGGLTPVATWACKAAIALVFSVPNHFFVNIVGRGLAWASLVVVAPFGALLVAAVRSGNPAWLVETSPDPDWPRLLNALYWNLSGFDCISTCSGEVRSPEVSLLPALVLCLALTAATYAVALGAVVALEGDWSAWGQGTFGAIACEQGGPWLGAAMVVAGAVGNMSLHVSELFEDSWQIFGVAQCGLAPRALAWRHPTRGTPTAALALNVGLILLLLALPFERILLIDNFFSILSAGLEVLAFVSLRATRPGAHRPYCVPVPGVAGAAIVAAFPLLVGVAVAGSSLARHPVHGYADAVAIVVGVLLYAAAKWPCALSYARPQSRRGDGRAAVGDGMQYGTFEVAGRDGSPPVEAKTLFTPPDSLTPSLEPRCPNSTMSTSAVLGTPGGVFSTAPITEPLPDKLSLQLPPATKNKTRGKLTGPGEERQLLLLSGERGGGPSTVHRSVETKDEIQRSLTLLSGDDIGVDEGFSTAPSFGSDVEFFSVDEGEGSSDDDIQPV